MKVEQIANITNQAIYELIGESELLATDLSNIVSVGQTVTNSTQFGENFENFTGKIIDKVGYTIFRDRKYNTPGMPAVYRNNWDYASVLEKIRCEAPDFSPNKEWDLMKGYDPTVFNFTAPNVQAKYFNKKTTYQVVYCFAKKQVESAFKSSENLVRFFAMIENRIAMQLDMAVEYLVYRTIANFVLNKADSAVINLRKQYNELTGKNLTMETCLADKEFLRYACTTIKKYKTFLNRPSMLFNNEGFTTFTPDSDMVSIFLTDFATALKTTLYADTFNKEFVELTNYTEVPYWQGSGTSNSLLDRSTINGKPVDESGVKDEKKMTGIVATIFDRDGVMVCNERPELTSIYNPEARFYKYWHTIDCSYFNDLSENGIVFTIADE